MHRPVAVKKMGRLRTLAMVLGLCVPAMLGAEEPIRVAVYKGGYGAEGICGLLQATPDTRAEYVSELDIATLRKYEVLVLPQTKRPKELTFDRMELIRSWVKDGHGLLVTHDAVGYRSHKSFFPQLSEGTGNPYSEQEAYSKECCIARTHPLTEGLALKERFYLSYYDYITINPGKDGVVVVRGVEKTEEAAASSAAVVVCGKVGNGRYVANGAALGVSMAGEVSPMGGEKRLLLNCIRWLAGEKRTAPVEVGEDIGQGAYLGPKERNLAINGSAEEPDKSGERPLGWGFHRETGDGEWGLSLAESRTGRSCAFLRATGYERRKVSIGLIQGESDGTTGERAYEVFPDMSYRASFWAKGDGRNDRQPELKVQVYAWTTQDGQKDSRRLVVSSPVRVTADWEEHSVDFVPENAKRMAIAFQLAGTEKTVPAGARICIDDVVIRKERASGLKGISVDTVLAACEQRIDAKWTNSLRKKELRPVEIPPNTEITFTREQMTPSGYSPLPEGWQEIDLSGPWKVKKLEGTEDNPEDDAGTRAAYWREEYDDTGWKQRTVPSQWDNEDKPYPDGDVKYGRYNTNFTGVGWYRLQFDIPETHKGQRLVLRFSGSDYETTVYLNGTRVGQNTGADHPFEFDVTDLAWFGEPNLLAVRVYDIQGVYHIDGHWCTIGGLFNKVVLQVRPDIYVRQLLIKPHLKDSLIEVDAEVVNAGKEARSVDLTAVAGPSKGTEILAKGRGKTSEAKLAQTDLKPGTNALTFTLRLKSPVYWTDDNPYLYTLRVKRGEQVIGKERFGFRDFKAKGRGFYLNGERVYLRGIVFGRSNFLGYKSILIDNQAQSMRRLLLAYKTWHVNTVFPQSIGPIMPRQFYDLCDELGILVYDWPGYDLGVLAEGQNLRQWFAERYNHPSVVLVAIGNENRHQEYVEPINALFDRLKKIDKQGRPICACSGNAPSQSSFKTDVEDFHAYPGAISGHPLDMAELLKRFNENVWRFDGKDLPVINWEMGGSRLRYEPRGLKPCREALAQDPVDKETVIALIEGADPGYHMLINVRWLSIYGIRRYIFGDYERAPREGRAVETYHQRFVVKGEVEDCRRSGDLIQGMGPNIYASSVFYLRQEGSTKVEKYSAGRLPDSAILTAEAYDTFKRSYSPRFVCLDVFDRNVFAGRRIQTTVYAINDTPSVSASWSVRVVIRGLDGQRLSDRTARIGKVESFKRKLVPHGWDIPDDAPTGFYDIETFLLERGKVISDNYYRFFVLSRQDLEETIPTTGKKVAVYDVGRAAVSTKKVLDDLGLEYTKIDSFEGLADYEVLIVGANSVDSHVHRAGETIREWLRNGGRLLQYEQASPGRISYIPQMHIVKKYGGTIADLIEITHPVFDKIRAYDNWDRWSGTLPDAHAFGRCGGIYSGLIGPLNQTVLATGVIATPRASDKAVAMLISGVKIGKGVALISQAEATRRYQRDSVATKYLRNTLKYILSDETRYARSVSGLSIGNVDYRRCGYVDLAQYADSELGELSKDWTAKVTRGIKSCGRLRFKLLDKGVLVSEKATIDLAAKMALMAPEWEAEKRKKDTDQLGLQLTKQETVFFLHTALEMQKGGTIGEYTFVYEDGTRVTEEIRAGVNIGDKRETEDLENARYVGEGFYVTRWMNPHQEKSLSRIEVAVRKGKGKLVIAGITSYLIREKVHW